MPDSTSDTLMPEPDNQLRGGIITAVDAHSCAADMGVLAGDVLVAVNGHAVEDVIDVHYHAAEYELTLTLLRAGEMIKLSGEREDMKPLGLSFEHPTFDIDIRRCNNLCEFCFVLQMAPRFRRTLYIKDDDYRYSFLFGHYVTLTNLSEYDERRIVEQRLSPLYVSVHATDLALRRQVLRNPNAPDIMEQLAHFIDRGIEFHAQIVVTPGVNDKLHLEQSLTDLATLYPGVETVSVVPVGLTRHHKYGKRPHTVGEANHVLDQCHAWQPSFRTQLGINFVYPTDEWYLVTDRPIPPAEAYDDFDLRENGLGMVRHFIDEWEEAKKKFTPSRPAFKHLSCVSGTLFAPTVTRFATEFAERSGVRVDVFPIINHQLGETITVAGLLMAGDVIAQLKEQSLGDVVVLPRIMFDHPDGISLDDMSPLAAARQLDRPVVLVDLMGDLVDLVKGQPALYFDPVKGAMIQPDSIQLAGGWAVEKYL
jgi:putative radical SAM enzyme (TIGR03279 family)